MHPGSELQANPIDRPDWSTGLSVTYLQDDLGSRVVALWMTEIMSGEQVDKRATSHSSELSPASPGSYSSTCRFIRKGAADFPLIRDSECRRTRLRVTVERLPAER